MRKKNFVCFLLLAWMWIFGASEVLSAESGNASSPSAPAASVPEKLFYKISLNESFFVRDREAVVNARATIELLQGDLDKVTLEVFGIGNGQGEIFNVSGEKVKDWSLRRENVRTFLEIRPKDLGEEKKFTLTISGRQPLKLPTTISPLLFGGVDSTAFFGIVQFLAPTDFRLYAKQERGLIPLGDRSRTQINYAIQGTPSLRLDIARANELLAPVSLEKFSLVGDIESCGGRFRLRAKALVREVGAEVPVLTGNAALLDFPEKNDFVVLAKTDAETGLSEYSLRFPARGEFDVDLQFDAGIGDEDGWRHLNFCVPVAQVAPYLLKGMPKDTVFAADNVSIPQANANGVFSGFLPSSGELDLRWRPSIPTPPEFSATAYALDTISEMQISTGVLKQKSEFNFTISQGELASLLFEVSGDGEILSVEGQDVLSWQSVPLADGKRGLFVRLSQPKTGKYRLRLVSQTRTGEFPRTLSPVRLLPAQKDWEGLPISSVCVRNNEFLRVRNGIGIRCEAVPQAGMTQVVASAFPRESDFFDGEVSEAEAGVYRLSSETEKLKIKADFIRSDLIVTPRVRWVFGEEKTTSAQAVTFEVRDAPLYEMQILIPEELELTALDSEIVASHEFSDASEKPGYRLLKIVFSEPQLGSGRVVLTLQKNGKNLGQKSELRACLFPQARFVFGLVALSGQKNMRLLSDETANLTEIAPSEYNAENPPQLAFRMRDGDWKLGVRAEMRPSLLAGVSSCVYKVGHDKIFGNLRVDYTPGGIPAEAVRLAFPPDAKVLSVSGKNVRDWTVAPGGVALVRLVSATEEKFSVSAAFEEPLKKGEAQAFEGVTLLDVAGESGTIFVTADEILTLSGQESLPSLATLPLGEITENYAARGGAILFRAYQFVERPFRLRLEPRMPDVCATPKILVTEARIASNAGRSCDIVYRYRSLGAKSLRIAVPEGSKVVCDGARELEDGTVALPLVSGASEIRFRLVKTEPMPENFREMHLSLPRVFAPVAKTFFKGFGDAKSDTMSVLVDGRKLNDSLDAAFFRRLGERFAAAGGALVAALLVFFGVLVAAESSLREKYVRIFRLIATAAGSVFVLAGVLWLTATVRPEYGDAVLVSGFTDAGAQLDVTLRRFYLLGGSAGLSVSSIFLIFVFCAGIFLLLWGMLLARLRLRLIGRLLIYVPALIFATEDFPYCSSAFVATVLVVEISVWALRFAVRLCKKIAAKKRAERSGNVGVTLLLAAMLLIPAAFAPELRAEDEDVFPGVFAETEVEEPHDVADRITQSIDVRSDRIVARGDIRVTGYAGDRFDLLASPAVLTSFEKGEKSMLRLERIRAKDSGFVYQVVLERAGTFTASFSYELALSENARGFPILSGAAAADVATVHVPRAEVQISAKGAVTTTLTPWGENSQIAQIVFKPKAPREVRWNPRERDRSRETLRLFASGENLYVPSAGLIEGRHSMKFVPAQGEISRVCIRVPKPFSVSRLEGAAIHRWNFNRETGILTVLFTAPRVSETSLFVFTQAQLSFLPVKQNFAALEALDCDMQVRTIGIATGETLQLDAVYAGNLAPIDEDEFESSLAAAGMSIDSGLRLRRAFRTVDQAGEFTAELSAVQPNLRIKSDEKFFVNNDSVRAEIDFSAAVSRAEIFNLAFDIPAGIDVDGIRGDVLSYWTKKANADGSARVTMHLKEALEGEQEFKMWLSGAFPQKAETWMLPGFSVVGARVQRGEISVSVDEGLRLQPVSSGTAMFTDASSEGRSDTFRYRYFSRGNESPSFRILESKPFTHADWLHRISLRGRYVHSRVDMALDIENVPRSSVRLRFPENALAVRVFGDDIVSSEAVAEKSGVRELKFSKPVRGEIALAAEFFTPLPLAENADVPTISVEGANRQSAWLAVERGNVFLALKSSSPEKVSEKDIPENFRASLDGREWFVEKYAEKYPAQVAIDSDAVAAWRESENDAHGGSFSASAIERCTIFNRDKALTEEKILLKAERSDVLRIVLPEGGVLKALAVNGEAADFVSAPDPAEACSVRVPVLAQEEAPITVSVVYEHPLVPALRGERKVFEIVPAEVLRADKTTWSLRSVDDFAETVDVFGRSPERTRTAEPEANAAFLAPYFNAKRRFVPDVWETFSADGNGLVKSGASVAFGKPKPAGSYPNFKIFLSVFFLFVVWKALRFCYKLRMPSANG